MTAEARARIVTCAILVVGFASAITIYFVNAEPDDASNQLENSKQYLRAMETYGGKANLLASELRHRFDALWHGRTLGFTVAVITVLVALAYLLAAMPSPEDIDRDAGDHSNGDVGGA
jgi:hypothetical protein